MGLKNIQTAGYNGVRTVERFIVTYIPSGTGRNFQWQLILHTWADQTMMGLIGGSHLIQTLLVLKNENKKD